MPALDALWLTGYGVAILVKIGLLAAALLLAVRQPAAHQARGWSPPATGPSSASPPPACCAG